MILSRFILDWPSDGRLPGPGERKTALIYPIGAVELSSTGNINYRLLVIIVVGGQLDIVEQNPTLSRERFTLRH
jgi:hypothetical protein